MDISEQATDVAAPDRSSATPRLPPGPSMTPIQQVLRWMRDPVAFLEECAGRHGDTFTIRLAATPPLLLFSHPEAVKRILTAEPDEMSAGEANGAVELALGDSSLLLLDGERHRRVRHLMLSAFHRDRLQAHAQSIRVVTERAIARWPMGEPFCLHTEIRLITIDVMLRVLFGETYDGSQLRRVLLDLLSWTAKPFVRTVSPFYARQRLRLNAIRLKREVDELVSGEIARRHKLRVTRDDLLAHLLEARDAEGRPLSNAELHDAVVTFLVAGHETTATSLAWLFHEVLGRPQALARIWEEMQRIGGPSAVPPLHLSESSYLDAAIKETLRLHPVFLVIGRQLRRSAVIAGYALPPGAFVMPCIYLAHRHPDVWSKPDVFRPERFLERSPAPHQFLPFGGGIRRCLGMAFALYEMKTVATQVFGRVVLRPVAGLGAHAVRRNVTTAPFGRLSVVRERGLPLASSAPA